MREIEQIKDSYGNLIQLWGVYEITMTIENTTYPRKNTKKVLISTHSSLHKAQSVISQMGGSK